MLYRLWQRPLMWAAIMILVFQIAVPAALAQETQLKQPHFNGNFDTPYQQSAAAASLLQPIAAKTVALGSLSAWVSRDRWDNSRLIAEANQGSSVLYRVNAGGPNVPALDAGPVWSADTGTNPSPFLISAGSNNIASFDLQPDSAVDANVPAAIYQTERWDQADGSAMQWAFETPEPGNYEVRLYLGNGFSGTQAIGSRIFDVAIEGTVPPGLKAIDPVGRFGHLTGGVMAASVTVTDGTLNIEFLKGVENPLINGIEIVQLPDQTPTLAQVSIAPPNPDAVVETENGDTVVAFPVIFEGAPASDVIVEYAVDINGNRTTGLTQPLGTTDSEIVVTIPGDEIDNGPETVTVILTGISQGSDRVTVGNSTAIATVTEDDVSSAIGSAVLSINRDSDNIQVSNYGRNSFLITNTGEKDIAKVEIDVTTALYPDAVFDPFGLAGDTATKALSINNNGRTGVIPPNNDPDDPNNQTYVGVGGERGFEGIRLFFNPNARDGFNPGETLGFSVDMDPNSAAGTEKDPLDGGTIPRWDVGGVSGAELVGSSFTVTFTDGTTATGQLQTVGNQAGAQGLASQGSPGLAVNLTANGIAAGGTGTYGLGGPHVIISGPAGQIARVALTKGFIQPIKPYAQFLQDQLDLLASTQFPANNAVEFQTRDVVLTGEDQDITNQFDFSGVKDFDFVADPAFPLSVDEDKLPIALVASIIDPTNDNLPIGPVTPPIYLQFAATAP